MQAANIYYLFIASHHYVQELTQPAKKWLAKFLGKAEQERYVSLTYYIHATNQSETPGTDTLLRQIQKNIRYSPSAFHAKTRAPSRYEGTPK
jgi:hypothetical protein